MLYLCSHARACISGDWAVFLDLKRNRYWAAPAARFSGEGLIAGASMASFDVDAHLSARLIEMGVVSTDRAQTVSIATRQRRAASPMHLPALCDLAYSFFWARHVVKSGALYVELEHLREARDTHRPARSHARIDEISAYFDQRRVWFPAAYVCLFDSLALAMFAARRGLAVDIVFGVRARPFAAHCWAEHRGAIVNDASEYCASFTPILRA